MNLAQEDPDAPTGDTVELSLPNDITAARRARHIVRDALIRWHLPTLVDSCVLVVSELVTNALRHGRPPIGMLLRRRAHDVRLDVRDSDPQAVARTHDGDADSFAEGGRGLAIVEAVADVSGSEHIPGDGKTVFASWRVQP